MMNTLPLTEVGVGLKLDVVDVIGVLTDQPDSRRAAKYWSVLKIRIKRESSELTIICSQLKLKSSDGKRYNTVSK